MSTTATLNPLRILGGSAQSGILREMAAAREWSVDLGGRTLAGREAGDGPALVLVNGYAATSADWDPAFVGALGATHRLICPDNRGVGGSGLGGEPLTIGAMAADLEEMLDGIGLDSAAVVGWSMGGFIAQQLAADAPARVERLVLLSTDPGGSGAIPADAAVWARLTDGSGSPREQASRLISLLFPPRLAPEIDERFGDLVAEGRAALSPDLLRAQQEAMDAWHRDPAAERLAAIEVPALIACGAEDVVIPASNSQLLSKALAGSRLKCFAGGGHAFMAQEPERLAALIADFLA
jgi:pimeloyl-ACP methyl ester carboxylesterase